MSFRRKIFLAAFVAALATVIAATALVSWSVRRDLVLRLERNLVSEARLAAALLSHQAAVDDEALDALADDIGARISARVTLIAPDGRVLGDSERDGSDLAAMENHGTRPEVIDAMRAGSGVATRHSSTIQLDMLYVAVPLRADGGRVRLVRLALPLAEVHEQLSSVRRMSVLVSRRVSAIAARAKRYAEGDYSRTPEEYGSDEIGTVARVLDQSVQDLSSRVAELARDRALTAGILAGMAEGVIVIDARGQLQLVNDAACRMLGLEHPGHGRHYLEAVRHPGIAGQLGAALRGEHPAPVEVVGVPDDDRVFIARASAVSAPQGPIAVVVLHDVSDLKRADRVRRDFVANVSHELRTPLTGIRGYIEALSDGVDDPVQAKGFLEVIARQSARMERLVRDLLRLARIESGQERVDRAPVPVASLFGEVEAALAPLIAQQRQAIAADIAPEAATIAVDAAKMHDVLRNLVENASRHAPEQSTITLRARRIDDRVTIEVADEGPGIPESDLSRVFERFYRVDKARARGAEQGGGTGLGLAIVKHLVGLHGGTVAARNGERGAVFTVSLPA